MLPLDVNRDESVAAAVQKVIERAGRPNTRSPAVRKRSTMNCAHPKIRYAPGLASRMRLLRRFAPARVLDAGVRRDLRLEA
jgi:hypothetical protein